MCVRVRDSCILVAKETEIREKFKVFEATYESAFNGESIIICDRESKPTDS